MKIEIFLGETPSRQTTYTPRLVCVDLKGSLGTLPELGDLYGPPGHPKTRWAFFKKSFLSVLCKDSFNYLV